MLMKIIDDCFQIVFLVKAVCGMDAAGVTMSSGIIDYTVVTKFYKHIQIFDGADFVLRDAVTEYHPFIRVIRIDEYRDYTVIKSRRNEYIILGQLFKLIQINSFCSGFSAFNVLNIPQFKKQRLRRSIITERYYDCDDRQYSCPNPYSYIFHILCSSYLNFLKF